MEDSCDSDDIQVFINGCRWINISLQQPEQFAIPLYGYVMPIIVAVTIVTNTFIVVVLSHKHLRTPTNFVLLAMAVTELLTGLTSIPWLVYYYTLRGYRIDKIRGLSEFWCQYHRHFSVNLPTLFHTAAIWLTVYLATQRYVYICLSTFVPKYCTRAKAITIVSLICALALLTEAPLALATYAKSHKPSSSIVVHMNWSDDLRLCVVYHRSWVDYIGPNRFYSGVYWFKALMIHSIPCILILIFSRKLVKVVRQTDRRRLSLLPDTSSHTTQPLNGSSSIRRSTTGARSLHATTRMLIVVIVIFLVIEIPVAVIFILHFLTVNYEILPRDFYRWMNVAIIFRNVFIILTYPFNFAIYCGMSEQFRLTVRQLFSRELLYVARPAVTFNHSLPRYSYQLVAIRKVTTKRRRRTSKEDHLSQLIMGEMSLRTKYTNSPNDLDATSSNSQPNYREVPNYSPACSYRCSSPRQESVVLPVPSSNPDINDDNENII